MVLLFDAANTLIYKPLIYVRFLEILKESNIYVTEHDLHRVHKLVSECHHFPDRTSKEFYNTFNSDVLYGLGVIPYQELLDKLFSTCSYLPWEKFDDTSFLSELPYKKAVLSNFHKGLNDILDNLFGAEFAEITISEKENLRKPDLPFFEKAIERLGINPSDILYIGDSIRLDLEPALKVGLNAWLIDRNNYYPACSRRLTSLRELNLIIQNSTK